MGRYDSREERAFPDVDHGPHHERFFDISNERAEEGIDGRPGL
jgi:hypothetical protein